MEIMVKEATKVFTKSFVTLSKRKSLEDERYINIREKAERVLNSYLKNPLSLDLINECDKIVEELQTLSSIKMQDYSHQRSQTNIVYISAQSKRTHYAAYMAGKFSASENLGGAFKSWMHNSAADGAISLYEAIRPIVKENKNQDTDSVGLLKVFGDGALADASRFLSMADQFYPNCAVSRYNEAKLAIYSEKTANVLEGIKTLKSIQSCREDCHPAEIKWHIDNYRCFQNRDETAKRIIEVEHPDEIGRIEQILENNANRAEQIESERGEQMWARQTKYTKAIISGFASGIVLATYLALGSEIPEGWQVLIDHAKILLSQAGDIGEGGLTVGGGGLLDKVAAATMGGGGLA